MITPAALAHVPLFASARDGALGPIVARSADIHVVTILVRGQKLSSNMSQYLIDQLAKKRNVFIQYGAECIGVGGTDDIESIDVAYTNGTLLTLSADALFIFIGARAETSWLPDALMCDAQGFICTGRDVVDLQFPNSMQTRDPYLLETSIPGIFAAGDVRHGSMKRVASSVREGSMAIALVHQFVAEPKPGPCHPVDSGQT